MNILIPVVVTFLQKKGDERPKEKRQGVTKVVIPRVQPTKKVGTAKKIQILGWNKKIHNTCAYTQAHTQTPLMHVELDSRYFVI